MRKALPVPTPILLGLCRELPVAIQQGVAVSLGMSYYSLNVISGGELDSTGVKRQKRHAERSATR
jgi:hypothetical protein